MKMCCSSKISRSSKLSCSSKLSRRLIPVLVVLWVLSMGSASAAFKYLHEGMVPSALKGQDLVTGEKVEWKPGQEDGQVSLVVFWATWSPRSLEMMRDLKDVQARYGEQGIQVYAVNVDGQNVTPTVHKQVKQVVNEMELPFPVVIDQGLELFYSYGVIAVPSLALVDTEGRLSYGPSGYSFPIRDRLIDSIEELLGLSAPTAAVAKKPVYQAVKKATRYHNLALQLSNKGKYDRALRNLEKAVAADSLFGAPHGLRGEIMLVQEEWSAAVDAFTRATELDSTRVSAWAGLGRACLGLEADEQAGAALNHALRLDDTYTPVLLDLARLKVRAGDQAAAAEYLAAVLELNPRDPAALVMVGKQFQEAGDLASAVAALQAAMEQRVTLPLLANPDPKQR